MATQSLRGGVEEAASSADEHSLSAPQPRTSVAFMRLPMLSIVSLLVGCPAPPADPVPDPAVPPAWDPVPADPPCGIDGDAPLLDAALTAAGLDRESFGFSVDDWNNVPAMQRPELDDEFLRESFTAWRDQPLRTTCAVEALADRIDAAATGTHGVASAIREGASQLDRSDDEPPLDPVASGSADFGSALAALCEIAGGDCEVDGEMPEDLGLALVPVLDGIAAGLRERYSLDEEIGFDWDADALRARGGFGLLQHPDGGLDSEDPQVVDFLSLRSPFRRLFRSAAQLGFAVEQVPWASFAGREGVRVDIETDAGWIRLRDGAADEYEPDEDLLLHLDLGGDDVYRNAVGANTSGRNAVALAIDLGGDDTYTYEEASDAFDFLLPADEDGRYGPSGDYPNARQSRSRTGRQGSGMYGIGMLFDLGSGSDHYRSLRMSQGYAHLGVGALRDDGGDDVYECEAACQGAAQWGIGVVSDGGGDDLWTSIAYSQGFGFVGGAGLLVEAGGNDAYDCNHGHPTWGGTPGIYPSAQMPTEGNASFCQGTGFGARALAWSGGLGVLRDVTGDDTFSASTFAQGSGYWQGTGVLSDGAGSDSYDAFYYVQGGAAHYALGVLADGGDGDDRFNLLREPRYMQMGAGHDFSTGILVNEAGDDQYLFGGLAMGASNCNGIGLVVDVVGDDLYSSPSDYGWGMGNHSGECIGTRPDSRSMGIMIDAGGSDTYDAPQTGAAGWIPPSEGGLWGHARNGSVYEHGGGVDGNGEAGVHAR